MSVDLGYLLRVPASLGLSAVEIVGADGSRDDESLAWQLPAGGSRAVWGLVQSRDAVVPTPFVQAYPELSELLGIVDTLRRIDEQMARRLDPPTPVDPGPSEVDEGRASPPPWLDDDLASALANLEEQVLTAVWIGQIAAVPLVRGYAADDDSRDGGLRQVLEAVWLDVDSFLTHAVVRVDEWRLHQRWYDQRPRWAFRGGPLPRRDTLDRWMPDPHTRQTIPYGLFPRGMHRTLFGTYVLHVIAHRDLIVASGPPPLARRDDARAAQEIARGTFPASPVHAAMRTDPAASLCDRVLNGIHAFALREAGPEGDLRLDLSFASWTHAVPGGALTRNAGTFLPDVTVRFARDGARLRLTGVGARLDGRSWVARGADDPLWPHLLHVARGALVLAGEIDVHLMTHLLAEHVQVALHQAVPADHPLQRVLACHVDGADVINLIGDWLILGPEGVVCASTPMTADDLAHRTAVALADAYRGWRTFAPRRPICAADRYAAAANAFWDALGPYLEEELAGVEVDGAVAALGAALAARPSVARPHDTVVPPITSQPELAQFCRFVLFHVTFLHGWVNDAQWDDGGEPALAPLAIRALPDPSVPYEAWARAATPTPSNAGYQMVIANALTRFDVGLALHDDVYPSPPPRFASMVARLPPPFTDRDPGGDRRLERSWVRSRLNS